MMRAFSSRSFRRLAVVGVCLAVGAVTLAFTVITDRDRAIAAAKKFGHVDFDPFGRTIARIQLTTQTAFREVLPLLHRIPDLDRLSVGGAPLSEEDVRTIGGLDQLRILFITRADLDDDDLQYLSRLINLRELRLMQNQITDSGLKHLLPLRNLEVLDLSFTRVRGMGLEFVVPTLREMLLTGSLLDDESIKQCTRFRHLARIDFQDTKVTERGLMHLVDLHWLTTIAPPREIPRETLRRFRAAYLDSTTAAAASGGDVPPDGRRLSSFD